MDMFPYTTSHLDYLIHLHMGVKAHSWLRT